MFDFFEEKTAPAKTSAALDYARSKYNSTLSAARALPGQVRSGWNDARTGFTKGAFQQGGNWMKALYVILLIVLAAAALQQVWVLTQNSNNTFLFYLDLTFTIIIVTTFIWVFTTLVSNWDVPKKQEFLYF